MRITDNRNSALPAFYHVRETADDPFSARLLTVTEARQLKRAGWTVRPVSKRTDMRTPKRDRRDAPYGGMPAVTRPPAEVQPGTWHTSHADTCDRCREGKRA